MPTKLSLSIPILILVTGTVPQMTGQAGGPAAPAIPESVLFERARGSVFVVESESGHGSGFLVDGAGLIVTNDHVVRNTGYLAVAVDSRRKYPAVVVARDRLRDVAILRVHPRAVERLPVLDLIEPQAGIRAGERVLAIGSALSDDAAVLTVGLVSGVAAETVLADLNVNPGSSGGPVLDMTGKVIGISTFIARDAVGPGLAGIVRSALVRPVLAEAIASLDDEPPPLQRLPVASEVFYPADGLRERVSGLRSAAKYSKKLGPFRVDVLTPPVVYYQAHVAGTRQAPPTREQKQTGRELKADPDSNTTPYDWYTYAARLEAIVGIRVIADVSNPVEPAQEPVDQLAMPFPRRASSGRSGTTGFSQMRLYRDGVEVLPIVPGRFCGLHQSGTRERAGGCIGLYQYSPDTFAEGGRLELHVYASGAKAKRYPWKLPPTLVDLVWSDFEPWRTRVREGRNRITERVE